MIRREKDLGAFGGWGGARYFSSRGEVTWEDVCAERVK